jgi:formylglycine-generating enzyme required for sulfatase activity
MGMRQSLLLALICLFLPVAGFCQAGADGNVMVAVSKAAEKYASRKPTAEEKKPEPVKPKPPGAKIAEEPKVATRLGVPSPPPAPPSPPQRSGDGAEMVSVPAGEFWMGSEESDAYAAEKPRRRVYLDAFRIDKYEVTNALYRRFIDARGHPTPSYWNDNWNEPNQPVVGVSWDDANAYCSWAGKRLPTEAEWEKRRAGRTEENIPGVSSGTRAGRILARANLARR